MSYNGLADADTVPARVKPNAPLMIVLTSYVLG